jgi:phage-related minor tail protein
VRQYERIAQALRNIIEGYGDSYLVPTYSLLDELAEDFGHTDAGAQLKKARDTTRDLVRAGVAARCEYAEENRRTSAIRFIVDAFNGKVDSILSRSKATNYGTLRQEILDAFALVNHLGAAFRDARITDEYLNARLDELKWAVVTHELREQEREEQRRIREQIREEERARREYERAIKDAAKEEETLRKAMEKARQEVARASEAERAGYEVKLADLAVRLRDAEEKNRRALSMAQQTKTGHVYVISNVGSFGEEVFKIGMTRRLEPKVRIRKLGDASVPFEFDVHALIWSEDAPGLERSLHRHFLKMQVNKVNPRKEFFRIALAEIRSELETLGVLAHWTMAAEAREYRETRRIEEELSASPAMSAEWVRHQLELDPVTESEPAEAVEEAA